MIHDGRNLADSALRRPTANFYQINGSACPHLGIKLYCFSALSLPIETRLFRLRHRTAIRKRAQQIARMVTFISPIYKPKTMTGLSLAFPILGKSLMLLSGRPVNFVFRCGFRRLAGTTRLLNIPMVLWAHPTFTSAGAATIGVSSLAAALKPSIG